MPSIHNLSTELDAKIGEYLLGDSRSLSSLTKTSKYYHSIAQPILYRKIRLKTSQSCDIKDLLITLLDRPDLAEHIRDFVLVSDYENSRFEQNEADEALILKDLLKRLNKLSSQIQWIVQPTTLNDLEFTTGWIREVLDQDKRYDGALSLILSMANNIERIYVCDSAVGDYGIASTMNKLMLSWHKFPPNGSGRWPFDRLKSLNVYARESSSRHRSPLLSMIPLVDTTTEVIIEGFCVNSTRLFHFPGESKCPSPPALHTLILENMEGRLFWPANFERELASPWLRNLRKLVMHMWMDWNAHRNYLPVLLRALEKHTKDLEFFEYVPIFRDPRQARPQFDTFAGLTKLHTLRTNLDLLCPVQNGSLVLGHLEDSQALFPPSLRVLDLTHIPAKDLDTSIEKLHRNLPPYTPIPPPASAPSLFLPIPNTDSASVGLGAVVSQAIFNLAAHYPLLKELHLGIWPEFCDGSIAAPSLVFLKFAADQLLEKKDLWLEVYTMADEYERERLLVTPGYRAPFPRETSDAYLDMYVDIGLERLPEGESD